MRSTRFSNSQLFIGVPDPSPRASQASAGASDARTQPARCDIATQAGEDKAARRPAAACEVRGGEEWTPVYLRSSSHQLPDLVADLGGQIEVTLAGKTDSVKGALRNTFEAVPDAPVSRFTLRLYGGKRGLIELSSGFCRHPRASVKLDGQNGKTHDTTPVVASSCPKQYRGTHRRGQ